MLATLKNKNFTLLWLGGLISMIGNWVLMAAMPFHVYALTGSALATSGLLMAYIAPGIVFGSVAGVFVDRWDRKRTMVMTSLMQAAILLVLTAVNTPQMIWLIYVVAFIEATLARFFSPAENALLPTLVGEEHLVAANSLNSLNDNLARLVGPAIGGALLGLVGFSSVVVVDAVTYLLAALLISSVAAPKREQAAAPSTETASSKWIQMWREWIAGLKYVRTNRILASSFLVIGIALFGDAIISAILVVFVQADMGLTAVEFGWMMTARGIGGLIGGLLIAQISKKFSTTQLITGGLTIGGILLFVAINFPVLPVVLPVLVLMGISVIPWIVSLQTLLQTNSDDAYRGRVFGAFGTTTTLLMFVGSALAGLLTDQVGAIPLMNSAAVIFVGSGLLAFVLFSRKPAQVAAAAD
jgi:MFS family permease